MRTGLLRKHSGIYEIGQRYGVKVANFEKENDTIEVKIPGTKEKIRLHRKAAEAERFTK